MQSNHTGSGKSKAQLNAEFYPLDDLLRKDRKGEFMTKEEKEIVKKYAQERRKTKV